MQKLIMLLRCLTVLVVLNLTGACQPNGLVYSPSEIGYVIVEPDDDIHIRSIEALTGVGELGIPRQRAVAMAIADYGPIKGHKVALGAGIDSLCTQEGGVNAAKTAINDPRVLGIVGTTCSLSAVAASPIISEAGLVMISAANSAPSLTSDLYGKAGDNYHPGYYRVASNDIHQARAVADFVYNELGLRRMAAINDGDPYTVGTTDAFSFAFADLGGSVVSTSLVTKGQVDMLPLLTGITVNNPEGIFFPLFPDEAGRIVRQIDKVDGLEDVTLITIESLLFTELESVDTYLVGPKFDFNHNTNEITGRSGEELLNTYQQQFNETTNLAYLAQAYDAATLLLRAIEYVAVEDKEGMLYIDRAMLRFALTDLIRFNGIIGPVSCDSFGDCGTGYVHISHYTDPSATDITELPVVFKYSPMKYNR